MNLLRLLAIVPVVERLDDAVQRRYQAWLIRDSNERTDEVLSWLPADTETFWLNREPLVVRPLEFLSMAAGRGNQTYSIDRIAALENGAFWKRLEGRTIRMSAAGARNLKPAGRAMPGFAIHV